MKYLIIFLLLMLSGCQSSVNHINVRQKAIQPVYVLLKWIKINGFPVQRLPRKIRCS